MKVFSTVLLFMCLGATQGFEQRILKMSPVEIQPISAGQQIGCRPSPYIYGMSRGPSKDGVVRRVSFWTGARGGDRLEIESFQWFAGRLSLDESYRLQSSYIVKALNLTREPREMAGDPPRPILRKFPLEQDLRGLVWETPEQFTLIVYGNAVRVVLLDSGEIQVSEVESN